MKKNISILLTTIISCISLFSLQATNKKYKLWLDDAFALRIAYVLDPKTGYSATNVLFEFDDKNGQNIVNALKPFLLKDEDGNYTNHEGVEFMFVPNKDSIYDKVFDHNKDKLIEIKDSLKMLDVFKSIKPILMPIRNEIHTAYVNHVVDSLYNNRISKLPPSPFDTLAIYVDYFDWRDVPLYFKINQNDYAIIKQNIDPQLLKYAENGMNQLLEPNSKPDQLTYIYDGRYFDTDHMIKRRITFSEYKIYLEELQAKRIAYDKETKENKRKEDARIRRNNAEYKKQQPRIIIIY